MPLNIALIFPGQGSQKKGMGLEFFQQSPQARAVFEQADKICGMPLSQVIFEGPEEKLTSTAFCQPAILTMSAAALEAFKASPQYRPSAVKFTAGHSLGEYAALYAAGALKLEDALRLVQKRASLMEDAARKSQGSMAAVIGFDVQQLMEICRRTGAEIANFNSPEQIVISGPAPKVNAAMEAIKAAGGQKIIPLNVSGAFHSSLMTPAAEGFAALVKGMHWGPLQIPVLSNFTGKPHDEAGLANHLAGQINGSVLWVKCVEYMISNGVKHFIEIGPGKVLKGLMRRIDPSVSVFNIEKPQDINALESA